MKIETTAASVDVAAASSSDADADLAQAQGRHVLHHAKTFTAPLLAGESLDTSEDALSHADAVASILATMVARPRCKLRPIWSTPANI